MFPAVRLLRCIAAATMLATAPAHAEDYVAIEREVMVNRPAQAVWTRIGGYCAIAEWMAVSCDYASGTGGLGTVRRLADGATIEPMVAQTRHSYTYLQTKGRMAAAQFHGTLAAEAEGDGRTRLRYTLVYDQSALPSDEVRRTERARLAARFGELLGVMKRLAEAR